MQFIHVYEELQNAVKKGTISNDEVQDELHVLCEKSNISYIVLDMDNEKLITNVHDTNMLKQQLAGYLLNQAQKGGKVLDSTDNYQLMRSQDPWNQSEYIEMRGQLDDNVNFLIRSPVESIRESVALSCCRLLFACFNSEIAFSSFCDIRLKLFLGKKIQFTSGGMSLRLNRSCVIM